MARGKARRGVEAEVDLHGLTAEQARHALRERWPHWRGMQRVRVIHGRGAVLKPVVELWCGDMAIPHSVEPGNPGAILLFPRDRKVEEAHFPVTLADAGLRAAADRARRRGGGDGEAAGTVEPSAAQPARAETAAQANTHKRDEELWQAEMARLDALDRISGALRSGDAKPGAPRIREESRIRFQEGYWRAELIRVADTDTETLKKQKRTGLDRLAPPIEPKPPSPPKPLRPAVAAHDAESDRALFEAEMTRLLDEG